MGSSSEVMPTAVSTATPSQAHADEGPQAAAADAVQVEAVWKELLAETRQRHPSADLAPIEEAYRLATAAHSGQRRKSGEPYLMHPLRVARSIARLGLDPGSICAALLHDAVEDTEVSVFELTERFGREVAGIVDGVTKLGKVPYLSRREQQAESFRKMLLAMSEDIRVLLVKLADRLDNMRTLEHMPPDKQERISRETMEIYAPLANRLGIEWIRRELQDLSFRFLEPATYASVKEQVDGTLANAPGELERTLDSLNDAMNVVRPRDRSAPHTDGWSSEMLGPIEIRATFRSPYKVHMMAQESGRRLESIADLVTYQIITRDRAACYAALGLLHGSFKPVPGRFRDYIALPRPNRYRALHTSVIDRNGERIELQIRSRGMDAVAEMGIVAEWENGLPPAQRTRTMAWLGQLVDWQKEVPDPSEFIEAVKQDLFADEVYVFTPQGDIHTFPKGATPIDFAFAIHSDVGMHCSGARVNGHIVPLRYRMRQGDTVEILTNPEYGPREEWLKICATPHARARIKRYLRQQERLRLRSLGRSLLEQEMSSRGLRLEEYERRGEVAAQSERMGFQRERGEDGIYEVVGAGQASVATMAQMLAPGVGPGGRTTEPEERNLFARMLRRMAGKEREAKTAPAYTNPSTPIEITRERIIDTSGGRPMIVLATCCSPLPGDPVVGFFEPPRGFVAHVEGCPEALEHMSEQRVHLAWPPDLDLERPVTLEVRTVNKVGLLAEMSRAFSHHGVNIKQANCRAYDDGERAINTFDGSVRNLAQLESLMQTLKLTRGVLGVERVFVRGRS